MALLLRSEKYKILSEPQFKHIAASTVVGFAIKIPLDTTHPIPLTETQQQAHRFIYHNLTQFELQQEQQNH